MLISSTNLWKIQTQPVPLRASLMAGEGWLWVKTCSGSFPAWWDNFMTFHRNTGQNTPRVLKPYFWFKKSLQEVFVEEKRRRQRRRCPCCPWCPCCLLYNISLHFVPHPLSSRNCSGSSSCRSMEIWVHAVYVIVASINALLICSGLQSSIRIIHLHALTHARSHARPQNWCFAKKNTDLLTAREMKGWKRRAGEETWAGRTTNNLRLLPCLCSASVLLQYWFAVLIIRFTYTQHKTMLNQQKYQ